MKVLMVDQFLPDSSYTVELCRALRSHAQVTIFCKKGAVVPLDGVTWCDKHYPGGKGKLAAVLEYGAGLAALAQQMRRGGYDVVHIQSFRDAKYEIPLICSLKKHCGMLVHTVHNLLPHEASERDRALYGRLYAACDLLVVHNEYCKRLLMQDYAIPEDKICVTPHGSYTHSKISPTPRSADGVTRLLQFGMLRQYKGVDILLKALGQMTPQQRSGLKVTIAGAQFPKLDGTDYPALVRQYGVEDCVELRIGHVPEQALDELYSEADFCLFPYREIYGSGALLMAYSYHKPVIASAIPAFREETAEGATGLLCAAEDAEMLRQAILTAAAMPQAEYAAKQQTIHALVQEKYNWEHSAQLLAEGYRAKSGCAL